eukprot:11158694-Lingulodinium_polyedra.AAC.1
MAPPACLNPPCACADAVRGGAAVAAPAGEGLRALSASPAGPCSGRCPHPSAPKECAAKGLRVGPNFGLRSGPAGPELCVALRALRDLQAFVAACG